MKILLVFCLLLFFKTVNAGLLIEPQLGYILSNKYDGTISLSGPATATLVGNYKMTTPEYGGRIGYQILGFMTGLSYSTSSASSQTIGSVSGTLKTNNLGAFVGFNVPFLLRGWFAYNFSAKSSISTTSFKGNSKEFGIGYSGIPFLSINFIYRGYDYTELTLSNQTYTSSNFTPKEMELAISAPFDLL